MSQIHTHNYQGRKQAPDEEQHLFPATHILMRASIEEMQEGDDEEQSHNSEIDLSLKIIRIPERSFPIHPGTPIIGPQMQIVEIERHKGTIEERQADTR